MVNNYIEKIKDYYKDNDELLIVGLGDERGINFEKNLLLLLKDILSSPNYDINTIDAFSTLLNKSRYIDSYLDHNVSTKRLKKVQMYGMEETIKQYLNNKTISLGIGVIGSYLLKSANEKELNISESIKNSKEPIIVYSSGTNDIIDAIKIKPSEIKEKYNKNREEYNCSLSLTRGEHYIENMNKIIDGNKKNIEKILGINDKSRVLVLGPYLYYKTEVYNKPFQSFVIAYSERLKELCHKYDVKYVGTRSLEKTPYQNPSNKCLRKNSYYLASRILKNLQEDIENDRNINIKPYEYDNEGLHGVLTDNYDYEANLKRINPRKYVETEKERKSVEKTLKRALYY